MTFNIRISNMPASQADIHALLPLPRRTLKTKFGAAFSTLSKYAFNSYFSGWLGNSMLR